MTGWYIKLVPTTDRDALIEERGALCPRGLSVLVCRRLCRIKRLCDWFTMATNSGAPLLMLAHIRVLRKYWLESFTNPISRLSLQTPLLIPAMLIIALVRTLSRLEKPYRMEDALRYAQELLKPLPGYLRVKVDVESRTLVPRFTFPDIAKRQYAEQLTAITEVTGWQVHVHPIIYPLALQDVLARDLTSWHFLRGHAIDLSGLPQSGYSLCWGCRC